MKKKLLTLLSLTAIICILSIFALSVNAAETSGTVSGGTDSWSYDGEGNLTITTSTDKFFLADINGKKGLKNDAGWQEFIAEYGSEVKTLIFKGASQFYGSNIVGTGLTELETVLTDSSFRYTQKVYGGCLFSGLSKLVTVDVYTTDSNGNLVYENEVVDLSSYTGDGWSYTSGFLKGCSSVKKVIMPKTKPTGEVNLTVDFFNGCTSLEEVTLPSWVTTLGKGYFSNCVSLKELNIGASITSIDDTAFTGANIAKVHFLGSDETVLSKLPKNSALTVINNTILEKATSLGFENVSILRDESWDGSFSSTLTANINYSFDGIDTLTLEYTDASEKAAYIVFPGADNCTFTNMDNFNSFVTGYGASVKTVIITKSNGVINRSALSGLGMPNIETILFNDLYRFQNVKNKVFGDMKKLKTLGITGSYKNGVCDLSSLRESIWSSGNTFAGSSAITNIILPADYTHNGGSWQHKYDIFAFKDCSSLSEITIPGYVTDITANTFSGCNALKDLTITSELTSISENAFSNVPIENVLYKGSGDSLSLIYSALPDISLTVMSDEIMENAKSLGFKNVSVYVDPLFNGTVENNKSLTWSYDGNGTLTFVTSDQSGVFIFGEAGNAQRSGYATDAGYKEFTDSYGAAVKKMVFVGGRAFRYGGGFSTLGCPNVETIVMPADISERNITLQNNNALFAGLTKLKSVTTNEVTLGKVDISKLKCVFYGSYGGMFKNCSSIEQVLLPTGIFDSENTSYGGNSRSVPGEMFYGCTALNYVNIPDIVTTIGQRAFYGCTSLRELRLPASVTSIGSAAFSGCTSLKNIYLSAEMTNAPTIAADAFSGCGDVNIYCSTSIFEELSSAVTAENVTVLPLISENMTHMGFAIRISGYNGLRSHFSFNENYYGERLKNGNYTLTEYGTITAAKAVYNNYEETLGLENSLLKLDGENIVTAESRVIKTAVYSNGIYNEKADVSDPENILFTVTIVNFDIEHANDDVCTVGYQIWEKDGEYFAVYTKYSNPDYTDISLAKATVGMLESGVITLENGDNPVMDTVNMLKTSSFNTVNENITGYLLRAPFNQDMYAAIYVTNSSSEEELTDLGISADERSSVGIFIYGKNVKCELPILNTIWASYMDEKLASLPDGKHFIFITDTHEGGSRYSTKYSGLLAKYAMIKSGAGKVIFGGDVITSHTLEASKTAFANYVDNDFYGVFGNDAIYVQGNHDANWHEAKSNIDKLLPETFIYEHTTKNIENVDGVVFNENGISKLDNVTFTANGNYSAEELKAEAIAAMKKHYYYDDTKDEIRYIVLDTGDMGITQQFVLSGYSWNDYVAVQLDFLADALSSVPENYDVVVSGHMMRSENDVAKTDAMKALYAIMAAYRSKTSVNVSVAIPESATGTREYFGGSSIDIDCDFSSNTGSGIIFVVSGHFHGNHSYLVTSDGGNISSAEYNDDIIAKNSVLFTDSQNDAIGKETAGQSSNMTLHTVTDQCFEIVTIQSDGTVVFTRIGAGDDRVFTFEK